MIIKDKSFLNLIIPSSVFGKEEIFNYILLYTNSDNADTKIYYESKILNSLSDSELLSIFILNSIFSKNNQLLLAYTNNKYFKLRSLISDNIENELEIPYTKTHIEGFDFNNYTDNITNKNKFNIVNTENKNTILVVDDEYIKYLNYVITNKLSLNIISNIFKNLNKDIYDNGIKLLLKENFHNSDVPGIDDNRFYKLNSFMKKIIENN